MRYIIRKISLSSALRIGCLLGWLVALVPAIVFAGISAYVLDRISKLFTSIQPISLTILGQEILHLDLLSSLGLRGTAQTVSQLAADLPVTFILFSLLFLVLGSLLFAFTWVLASVSYNLLASMGGGLEVDLLEERSASNVN